MEGIIIIRNESPSINIPKNISWFLNPSPNLRGQQLLVEVANLSLGQKSTKGIMSKAQRTQAKEFQLANSR